MITVVNKYHGKQGEYIGRGSPLGNPFRISEDLPRGSCILLYKTWVEERIALGDKIVCDELNRLYTLAKRGDVALQCFCSPRACHGDIIKSILEVAIENSSIRHRNQRTPG